VSHCTLGVLLGVHYIAWLVFHPQTTTHTFSNGSTLKEEMAHDDLASLGWCWREEKGGGVLMLKG
jgi:hypothetical protein